MPAGRAIIVPDHEEMFVLSSDAVKMVPVDFVDVNFLVLGINSIFFKNQVQGNTQGITRARTSIGKLKTYAFPLPPISEQHRITNQIESLFERLDRAKALVRSALDSFENRKASMLHKAFTGELTANWREENGVELDSWEEKTLGDVFEVVGGIQKTPARLPRENPIPYLAVANVLRGELFLENIKYFEVTATELERYGLKMSDLLIVEGNGSAKEIGRCAIWNEEITPCVHQNHIIRLRANTNHINSNFALYYLNSERGKDNMKSRAVTTAGLYNLSTGKIKSIDIPVPSLTEQQEIVRILDMLIENEKRAKELSNTIEKIDHMKKAIQARAVRSELGTNDPSEESAVNLLCKILSEV